jgi:SAM-dependent MidA family methyltransferase
MADILRVGAKVPEFLEKVHVRLVETQGLLRKKQKAN